MKLVFLYVGKTREKYLADGISLYKKRLQHYIDSEIWVLKAESIKARSQESQIIENESQRIIKACKGKGPLLLLDRRGSEYDSVAFSHLLKNMLEKGHRTAFFAVGGPLGVSDSVVSHANQVISISSMTFTHEMSRLILLEQVYRAFTIIKGEKYHK